MKIYKQNKKKLIHYNIIWNTLSRQLADSEVYGLLRNSIFYDIGGKYIDLFCSVQEEIKDQINETA
jgi:hypothetical protein